MRHAISLVRVEDRIRLIVWGVESPIKSVVDIVEGPLDALEWWWQDHGPTYEDSGHILGLEGEVETPEFLSVWEAAVAAFSFPRDLFDAADRQTVH